MADDLRKFMQAELVVMLRDIGQCENTESANFAEKALQWIEKNAADFRARWDANSRKIVARKKRATRKVYDVA